MDYGDANEDALLTAPQAALWFTAMRGEEVTRHMVYGWMSAGGYEPVDHRGARHAARFRYGDLLAGEKRSRLNVRPVGRGRPKAA